LVDFILLITPASFIRAGVQLS